MYDNAEIHSQIGHTATQYITTALCRSKVFCQSKLTRLKYFEIEQKAYCLGLFCFSSSCVPFVASFSAGFYFFDCPFGFI